MQACRCNMPEKERCSGLLHVLDIFVLCTYTFVDYFFLHRPCLAFELVVIWVWYSWGRLWKVVLFCSYSHQEIARLQEENDKLKSRLRTIESQVWQSATYFQRRLHFPPPLARRVVLLSLLFCFSHLGHECARWENQGREGFERPSEGARWTAGMSVSLSCK